MRVLPAPLLASLLLLSPLGSSQQEVKIWAHDGAWYDRYGGAVALDGERAIVEARRDADPKEDPAWLAHESHLGMKIATEADLDRILACEYCWEFHPSLRAEKT